MKYSVSEDGYGNLIIISDSENGISWDEATEELKQLVNEQVIVEYEDEF